MTAPDLKPCPFCGGEAEINPLALATSDFNVACFNGECPVEPQTRGETKDEAIAAWNTRAVDPAAIREAALREAAEAVSNLADHALTALAYEHAQACREEILELLGEKE
jgi:Lar family restriction alleviation protein